jgi:hypothetical protein
MQEGRVISYSLWQLMRHEEHYPIHDLELTAVVMAFRTWRYYLLGNVIHIYTVHKSLKYIFTQLDLNMRQRRWLELIKDYKLEVHYHPRKTNVVADALSHKAHYNYLPTMPLIGEDFSIRVLLHLSLYNITLTPTLREEVISTQKNDEGMVHLGRRLSEGDPKANCFREDAEGILWFKDRLVVPKKESLKKEILDKAHTSRYSIHPASTKTYHDLMQQFWWTRMKCKVARYVSECNTCRKVKADYMKPGGLLQPLSIPDWKWEDISMDFIVGLPLTAHKVDAIWMIFYCFTKYAHFIPVHTCFIAEKYVEIYIPRILCLHGFPKMIISDRGSSFVARFWEQLHASLGIHLIHSSTYHPQTDGQIERVNQILEDMLRACVMEYPASWGKNLPWVEFSYNNSYQESLKMAPFEELYGC